MKTSGWSSLILGTALVSVAASVASAEDAGEAFRRATTTASVETPRPAAIERTGSIAPLVAPAARAGLTPLAPQSAAPLHAVAPTAAKPSTPVVATPAATTPTTAAGPAEAVASPAPVAVSGPANVTVPAAVAVNVPKLDKSSVRLLMSFNRTVLPD